MKSPKRAHIVFAHPEPHSFVASMRDIVQESLESTGWKTSVTDLQSANFKAVASAEDFTTRERADYLVYSLEQRQAWKTGSVAPEIKAEVDAVTRSDLLVLVFPIFWFSVPALMKGWIDRVFLSGVFYGGRRIYGQGGMNGKHALVVASLGGREQMFGPNSIHGNLNGMLRHLLQGTLGYAGFSVYDPFFAYHVPYLDSTARTGILIKLMNEIRQLDSRSVLQMPKLEDFDDQFRPRTPEVPK